MLGFTTKEGIMKEEDRRLELRRSEDGCSPNTCHYHALTDSVITDLKEAVHKLMEGQEKMRESLIIMTEAFKAVERLDGRVEKLEVQLREKDKEQDSKIDKLRVFMYKSTGAVGAIAVVIGYLTKFIGG